MIPSLFYVLLR